MKVLIVDDQPDVVQGILSGVNWKRLKVEKAYGACSAKEAREILEREKIQILLCDIEMPGENGLSLVSWVRENLPETKCIFLTAHADFSYARTALKLEAVDYLLQPASYQSIEEAILKASQRLTEEQTLLAYSALGQGAEREVLNFRRNLLRDFLQGTRLHAREAANRAEAFGFSCTPQSPCRCALAEIQLWQKEPVEQGVLLYAFQNVAEELLGSCAEGTTVLSMGGDSYFVLALSKDLSPEEEYKSVKNALERFVEFIRQEFHLELSCYLQREPVVFEELPKEYRRLQEAHRNNVAKKSGLLFLESDSPLPYVQPEFSKWKSLLSQGAAQAVREEIHRYLNSLADQGALNREVLSRFHEDFLELFFSITREYQESAREVFTDTFDYDAVLSANASLPQLLEFVDFATEYVEEKQGKELERGRTQIDRVLSFIQENLPRNIGRQEIAKAVYLNPEYLSRLFKKEMGIALSDYLTQERMKIAKSLLLNTSFSISIIASKAGYVNFSHFAKAFKKEFGMSPSEYRKENGKEE